jgi:hypothetical protein
VVSLRALVTRATIPRAVARKVFFSFHYKRDIFRANVVRRSWQFRGVDQAGYFDSSIWQSAHAKGDAALEKLIRDALVNTSVTAVLIGVETWRRKWVHFEITESRKKGNGLLGIRIHAVPCATQGSLGDLLSPAASEPGRNPFEFHRTSGETINPLSVLFPSHAGSPFRAALFDELDPRLDRVVPVYHWQVDDGYNNFGNWVDAAAARGSITKIP